MTRTLTPEQIERHMLTASECPPSSKVLLISTVRRLLGHEEPAPQEAPAETPDAGPVAWIADEELKRLKENGRIWVVADLWAVQQDYDSVGKTFTQIPLYLHPAPSDAQALRKALEQLVRLEDMRLRLHKAQESGHGTDYDLYRDNLSAAWYDAHAALGGGK